jgi:hypothetical protein
MMAVFWNLIPYNSVGLYHVFEERTTYTKRGKNLERGPLVEYHPLWNLKIL